MGRPADDAFRPLRRVEYEKLVELGCFDQERLELLEGALIRMPPQRAPHAAVVQNLSRLLTVALAPHRRAEVRVQLPYAATDDSMPEPDIAVVPAGSYFDQHPRQALLIVEVADTTLAYDRTTKKTIYARAGVPEYWVVDVVGRAVDRHRRPRDDTYSLVARLDDHEHVSPEAFDDLVLEIADFFQ